MLGVGWGGEIQTVVPALLGRRKELLLFSGAAGYDGLREATLGKQAKC